MTVDDAVIEVVADYLRRTRWQRDRPNRLMARQVLKLAEEARAGTRVEPTAEEIAQREAEAQAQRRRARRLKRQQTMQQ
jgi:hypothetical protein